MALGPKQVHIVSTSFEYANASPEVDRIGHIYKEEGHSASKIYVLTNSNPLVETELEKEALEGVIENLQNLTLAGERGGIIPVEVDFFSFEDALIDVYEIIYNEKKQGNHVFTNISGGTKPLAIAMTFACALAGLEKSPFYVPKHYSLEEDTQTISVDSRNSRSILLNMFNLENILPEDEPSQKFLVYLLRSEEEPIGVTDLLVQMNEIAPNPSSGDNDRTSVIQRYHRRSEGLLRRGLIQKKNNGYVLTPSGRIMAKIMDIRMDDDFGG